MSSFLRGLKDGLKAVAIALFFMLAGLQLSAIWPARPESASGALWRASISLGFGFTFLYMWFLKKRDD